MPVKALRAYAPAKRPQRGAKGELKRKQILDAAAKVLARRGYIGTQLSEIAAEAGTLAGSLYYHFESREELLEEVLHEGVDQSFSHARKVLDELPPGSTPLERLCAAVSAHLKFQLVESDCARAAAHSMGQAPQDVWRRVNERFRKYGKFFDDLIEAAMKSGELDPRVNRSAVRMLIIGAANYAPEWYRQSGALDADQLSALLVRLLVRGAGTGS
ncbi:MAG TPA: TetR/AcrR family transcriptional regulator [Candidatus Binataceae bacterium]|nr:TetR/AcrR family transcriptional regulator [Candidatus Binataceae bacterium]